MEYFPAPLEKLVEQFARLPGIGGKATTQIVPASLFGEAQMEQSPPAVRFWHTGQQVTSRRSLWQQTRTPRGKLPLCISPGS